MKDAAFLALKLSEKMYRVCDTKPPKSPFTYTITKESKNLLSVKLCSPKMITCTVWKVWKVFFLVHIFKYFHWIWRFISKFIPNLRKYRPEKNTNLDNFYVMSIEISNSNITLDDSRGDSCFTSIFLNLRISVLWEWYGS